MILIELMLDLVIHYVIHASFIIDAQAKESFAINAVNQKTSACGFHVEEYHQIWLTNLAER